MMKIDWSQEGLKNSGLSDKERWALEKTVGTQLEQSLADSEKTWKKQQASVEKLLRKYKSQFEDNLKIELEKIDVSPKTFDADMSDWIKAEDPKLRDELGLKINKLYLPALRRASGSLGADLMKLQKQFENAVISSPASKFQWIGPIGFAAVE